MQPVLMSFRLLILSCVLGLSGGGFAQPAAHRAIFEITSDKTSAWTSVLNHIENLRKSLADPGVQIEVVAHGPGLAMLKKTHVGPEAERMRGLAGSGVVFAACENTLKRQNLTRSDLLPFVGTVDSGIAEVVRKQTQGWSYVHES